MRRGIFIGAFLTIIGLAIGALILNHFRGSAERFSAGPTGWAEGQYVLRDSRTGAYARILARGAKCIELALPNPAGVATQLLLDSNRNPPGMPILFPFAGRIPRGEYEYAGKKFRLPTQGRNPIAMHGFVGTGEWKVESTHSSADMAVLTLITTSEDYPSYYAGYPHDWTMRAIYSLNEAGMALRLDVTNNGSAPMPFSLGLHPWFRRELGGESKEESLLAEIPASQTWNGGLVESFTSGRKLNGKEQWRIPVTAANDLRKPTAPREGGGVQYTSLANAESTNTCHLIAPVSGLQLVLDMAPEFQTVVLFNPKGSKGICIEPWTAPPNVFNIANAIGKEASDLIELAGGSAWSTSIAISLKGL